MLSPFSFPCNFHGHRAIGSAFRHCPFDSSDLTRLDKNNLPSLQFETNQKILLSASELFVVDNGGPFTEPSINEDTVEMEDTRKDR
jgi:hypothetical protein